MTRSWATPWVRRGLALTALAVALSPAFAWAAGAVGYTEPMERAAAAVGATDAATTLFSAPLADYAVPLLGPHLGTLAAAIVGAAATLLLSVAVGRGLAGGA